MVLRETMPANCVTGSTHDIVTLESSIGSQHGRHNRIAEPPSIHVVDLREAIQYNDEIFSRASNTQCGTKAAIIHQTVIYLVRNHCCTTVNDLKHAFNLSL